MGRAGYDGGLVRTLALARSGDGEGDQPRTMDTQSAAIDAVPLAACKALQEPGHLPLLLHALRGPRGS